MSQEKQLPMEGVGERERMNEIWEFCYSAHRWVTRAEIARALSLKKTPALIGVIELMVRSGFLERAYTVMPNGAKRYSYQAWEG